MSKKSKLLDRIGDDVSRKSKIALRRTAKQVTKDIKQKYKDVVTDFYNDYPKPKHYDRTYSTYQGGKEFDPVKDGNAYIAGVEVSPDNITGEPYNWSKDAVFERTFVGGIHGSEEIKRMHPSPDEELEKAVREYAKSDRISQIFSSELGKVK